MPSDFNWTAESISEFWDDVASEPRFESLYFTKAHAKHLVELGKLFGLKQSHEVLDFGCGPGYLSAELVRQGFRTGAIEFSPQSAQKANEKLNGNKNWLGCDIQTSDNPTNTKSHFDWVFSIETFEHLLDEWIPGYVQDLKTRLKHSGKLLLSTPSEEDLDSALILCPHCHSKFHRWGHLRTTTAHDLASLFSNHGFKIDFCRAINLDELECVERIGIPHESELGFPRYVIKRLLYEVRRRLHSNRCNTVSELRRGPHLILVASL